MYKYQQEEYERRNNPFLNVISISELEKKKPEPKYVSMMTSISHTYGNVIAFMREWLLNQFPENMFKTIHVNSKIAHRQLSTKKEFFKKGKPMLIMRPRFADWNEERFLKGTMFTEKKTNQYNTWGGGNLEDFFSDPKNDISIKYQLNRSVIMIDVILIFETAMQQMDFTHYLSNKITPERPMMLNTNLESYIPLEMIDIISKLSHIGLYDGDGSTKTFLSYLQGCSTTPLTYKLQGSTGNKEFFRYYNTNIEAIVSDISHDDGNKFGQVNGMYQISFSVRCEFYSTGFYYLFSPHIFDIDLPQMSSEDMLDSKFIPLFTDTISKEDLNLPIGWNIYNSASCILEVAGDEVEIGEMLNQSIKNVVEYYKKNGLPLIDILDIKIRRQGKLLHYGKDYEIDLENYKIRFKNESIYFTYRIIICVNADRINDVVKNIYNLK